MALAFGNMGLDPSLINLLHEVMDLDLIEDTETSSQLQAHSAPSRAFVREARAMAATPADAKELPNAYVYVLDMPGLKKEQIKVAVEDRNTLVVSGERKREKERDQGVRYLKMGRRLGKYLQSFSLPENANKENISAVYQDGVLTVTVEKKAPEEPKRPHTIEVNVV